MFDEDSSWAQQPAETSHGVDGFGDPERAHRLVYRIHENKWERVETMVLFPLWCSAVAHESTRVHAQAERSALHQQHNSVCGSRHEPFPHKTHLSDTLFMLLYDMLPSEEKYVPDSLDTPEYARVLDWPHDCGQAR